MNERLEVKAAVFAFLYLLTFMLLWAGGILALSGWIGWIVSLAACVLLFTASLFVRSMVASIGCWLIYSFVFPPPVVALSGYLAYSILPLSGGLEEHVTQNPEAPLFLHISDSHFIGKEDGRTYQGESWSVEPIRTLVEQVQELRPNYLLVTGDITDIGSDEQWQQAAKELLAPLQYAGIRVILAPGNHDLQPAFSQASSDIFHQIRTEADLEYRFLSMQAALVPDLHTTTGSTIGILISAQDTDVKSILAEGVEDCALRCSLYFPIERRDALGWCAKQCKDKIEREITDSPRIRDVLKAWGACTNSFPILDHNKQAEIMVIVLCSRGATTWSLANNALGAFGRGQLERLNGVLTQLPAQSRFVLLMLHHPPIRREHDRWGTPKRWWSYTAWMDSDFMRYATLRNATAESIDFVDMITRAAEAYREKTFVLLFGHAHNRFFGTLCRGSRACSDGKVWVSEAPAIFKTDAGGRLAVGSLDSPSIRFEWLGHVDER